MNRRDLTGSKLWCGQRQDVNPGCVWTTRDLVQSVCRLLQFAAASRNRSVSVWFMRRGEANPGSPGSDGASPYRAGVNAGSGRASPYRALRDVRQALNTYHAPDPV
jgi:hypothetical protein